MDEELVRAEMYKICEDNKYIIRMELGKLVHIIDDIPSYQDVFLTESNQGRWIRVCTYSNHRISVDIVDGFADG